MSSGAPARERAGLRVAITGASGLVGRSLLRLLVARGAQPTVLSRDPARAHASISAAGIDPPEIHGWEPAREPAPDAALAGRDAVVNLAGENISQRWSEKARRAIRDSRVEGTRNLVEGLRVAQPRPGVLISGSAVGYYGHHGEEPLDEEAPAGRDFLAGVCAAWEAAAESASELGMRVVRLRTGVVLDRSGGALAKMLTPFRLGVGGPVAGGHQYISWIHAEDLVGMILAALAGDDWRGAINGTAPGPVTNAEFSKALGRALRRPALLAVPGAILRLAYGEMAEIVTTGARAVPAKALVLGYRFSHPNLDEALRSALAPGR